MTERSPDLDRFLISLGSENHENTIQKLNNHFNDEANKKVIIETCFDAGRLHLLEKLLDAMNPSIDTMMSGSEDIGKEGFILLMLNLWNQVIEIVKTEHAELYSKRFLGMLEDTKPSSEKERDAIDFFKALIIDFNEGTNEE